MIHILSVRARAQKDFPRFFQETFFCSHRKKEKLLQSVVRRCLGQADPEEQSDNYTILDEDNEIEGRIASLMWVEIF